MYQEKKTGCGITAHPLPPTSDGKKRVTRKIPPNKTEAMRASTWWLEKHAPELYGKINRKKTIEGDARLKIGTQPNSLTEIERKLDDVLKKWKHSPAKQ